MKKLQSTVFESQQFVLQFPKSVNLGERRKFTETIRINSGLIAFALTKSTFALVVWKEDQGAFETKRKIREAEKLGVPAVGIDYILNCIEKSILDDPWDFAIKLEIDAANIKKRVLLKDVKPLVFSEDDPGPFHGSKYEIIKAVLLNRNEPYKKASSFICVELQASSENAQNFCVFATTGKVRSTDGSLIESKREVRFLKGYQGALDIYEQLCALWSGPLHSFTRIYHVLHPHIGSPRFRQLRLRWLRDFGGIEPEVARLVDVLWSESTGHLEECLDVSVYDLDPDKVRKAMATLFEVKQLLLSTSDSENPETQSKMEEFYRLVPHKRIEPLTTKLIAQKQDLCQLVSDVCAVSEVAGTSDQKVIAKYRALRCHISHVSNTSEEFRLLERFLIKSGSDNNLCQIKNIFRISRGAEEDDFRKDLGDAKQLFHSTAPSNLLGILSRGLLLPRTAISERGVVRTDQGNLGSGLYFASDPATNSTYSSISKFGGCRYMMVHEVALGRCLETYGRRPELIRAPPGYESVHGVKKTKDRYSEFNEDEYCVYSTDQQMIQYLVEFSFTSDKPCKPLIGKLGKKKTNFTEDAFPGVEEELFHSNFDSYEVSELSKQSPPPKKLNCSLKSTDSGSVEAVLIQVSVNAHVVDTVARVTLSQTFFNPSPKELNTEYVFPLGEKASVCGFEAFIKDRHVVGKVTEKQEAKQKFVVAVSEGHGAYLLDEEKPNVFSAQIGNLPAKTECRIVVTYVIELDIEGDSISFHIPSSVAPWIQTDPALKGTTSSKKTNTSSNFESFRLKALLTMPSELRNVHSPSHKLTSLDKTNPCSAEVTMELEGPLEEDFRLLVDIAEPNASRLWIDDSSNEDEQTCMLTVFPKFSHRILEKSEMILVFDCSNSMIECVESAQTLGFLLLDQLPDSCVFNVVFFGSVYQELFPTSQPPSVISRFEAQRFIKSLVPKQGSSNFGNVLNSFFSRSETRKIQSNVFLISDGYLNDESTLYRGVKNVPLARIFTLGVGKYCNTHAMRRLAVNGGGTFDFFDSNMKKGWHDKISRIAKRSQQPAISNVSVEWLQDDKILQDKASPSSDVIHQAPKTISTLFSGDWQVVYAFAKKCSMAVLKTSVDGIQNAISVRKLSSSTGSVVVLGIRDVLKPLAARAVIRDWEDGILEDDEVLHEAAKRAMKHEIVLLSIEHGILCSLTSFLAIEEREKKKSRSRSRSRDRDSKSIDRDIDDEDDEAKMEEDVDDSYFSSLKKKKKKKLPPFLTEIWDISDTAAAADDVREQGYSIEIQLEQKYVSKEEEEKISASKARLLKEMLDSSPPPSRKKKPKRHNILLDDDVDIEPRHHEAVDILDDVYQEVMADDFILDYESSEPNIDSEVSRSMEVKNMVEKVMERDSKLSYLDELAEGQSAVKTDFYRPRSNKRVTELMEDSVEEDVSEREIRLRELEEKADELQNSASTFAYKPRSKTSVTKLSKQAAPAAAAPEQIPLASQSFRLGVCPLPMMMTQAMSVPTPMLSQDDVNNEPDIAAAAAPLRSSNQMLFGKKMAKPQTSGTFGSAESPQMLGEFPKHLFSEGFAPFGGSTIAYGCQASAAGGSISSAADDRISSTPAEPATVTNTGDSRSAQYMHFGVPLSPKQTPSTGFGFPASIPQALHTAGFGPTPGVGFSTAAVTNQNFGSFPTASSSTQTSFLFGARAPPPVPPPPTNQLPLNLTTGFSFGSLKTTTATSGGSLGQPALFGSTPAAALPSGQSGLFGSYLAVAPHSGQSGLFGSSYPAAAPPSGQPALFGSTPAAAPPSFAAQPTTSSSSEAFYFGSSKIPAFKEKEIKMTYPKARTQGVPMTYPIALQSCRVGSCYERFDDLDEEERLGNSSKSTTETSESGDDHGSCWLYGMPFCSTLVKTILVKMGIFDEFKLEFSHILSETFIAKHMKEFQRIRSKDPFKEFAPTTEGIPDHFPDDGLWTPDHLRSLNDPNLNEVLDRMIGQLRDAGLDSLGSRISERIQGLVSTVLMVVILIRRYIKPIINLDEGILADKDKLEEAVEKIWENCLRNNEELYVLFAICLSAAVLVNLKYPLVYRSLGLGSWDAWILKEASKCTVVRHPLRIAK